MELNDELDRLVAASGERRLATAGPERRAIVVAGSHRSGTSALARVLNLVGCELPKHVMPPLVGSNELGFWEPAAVIEAHDIFLASIGSSWDDVAPVPEGALVSAAARELRQQLTLLIRDEYGVAPLIVVKDPRLSRLLPLWLPVLADLRIDPAIAITVRNPLEVAASLKARDGFSTTKSLLLWLRHTLEAEQHSRGYPRSIVMYDTFLRDWQGVLARVASDLGVTWPGISHRATVEIESFLSEQHRHHVFDWRDVEGRADVVSWVKETYFALRNDPESNLDHVREELSRADMAFGPIVEEARQALLASNGKLLEAEVAQDALAAEFEARGAALEERDAEIRQLQGEVAELTRVGGASEERIAAGQVEVDALRAQRDAFAHEIEILAGELERLASTVEAAQSQAIAAEGHAVSAREELAASRAQQDSLRAQTESAVSRAAAIEADAIAERAALLTRLEAARGDAEVLGGQLAAANAAHGALEARAALERGELLERTRDANEALERLSDRALAAESEASAERKRMLSDLDIARSEAHGLATELGARSREVDELAEVADELLLAADAELAALRVEKEQLQSELADKLVGQGQLLVVLDHLKGALESATAKLGEQEQTADSFARESAARREEFEAERTRLVTELEAARTDLARARSEIDLVHSGLDAARGESDQLVADLETARTEAGHLTESTANLEGALNAQRALSHALQSVTRRRTPRRRSLSQLGTWLLPPTPRKLNYLRQYLGLRLSDGFDLDAYLLANPDVLAAGINPIMHYVEYGRAEGRQPPGEPQPLTETGSSVANSDENAAIDEEAPAVEELPAIGSTAAHAVEPPADAGDDDGAGSLRAGDLPAEVIAEAEAFAAAMMLTDEIRAELGGDFDSDYYRGTYEDIDRVAIDPLEHYFYTGWREGRDPSPDFSTSYYLSSNPDVAAAEVNPLVHYVLAGKREGRQPYPPTGFRRQTLQSLEEEISEWQHGATALEAPLDGTALTGALAARIGARRHAVVSISHDNYTMVAGGAQLCVALEQKAYVEEGCAYINLHPARALPVLSRETQPEALELCVLCDGESVGCASAATVIAALSDIRSDQGVDFGLVVHALHGHSPEAVVQLHDHLAPRWAWLWLHDYFGICPNAQLLRNRIEPCSAPPPDSPGCTICIFGEERLRHLPRFRLLLESVPFNLVAPSQFMADRWRAYVGDDQLAITVHENGQLTRTPSGIGDIGSLRAPARGPARVAFLGTPAVHKGWDVFLELVRRSSALTGYHFYHFGDGRFRARNVVTRTVNVAQDGPLAMIEALRRDSIDLALVWSLWEESFSYTAHEALAAGVAILTNPASGNIARVVAASDDGIVFGDEHELFASFDDGLIPDLVEARRKNRQPAVLHFSHSRMTADLSTFDD